MKLKNTLKKIRTHLRKINQKSRFEEITFSNKLVSDSFKNSFSPSFIHGNICKKLDPVYGFTDGENVNEWQKRGLIKLTDLLSCPNLIKTNKFDESKCIKVWTATDKLGTYEKYYLQGEYQSWVPVVLCVPHKHASNQWIVCSQGHNSGLHNSIGMSEEPPYGEFIPAGDRDYSKWCMNNGIAAACIEHRCFGEREERGLKSRANHGCQDAAMHALALGRTLLGERLIDIKLLIDFLKENRGACDFGLLGNSSGGTISILGAALLDDIKYCIASSCFSSLSDSIMSKYHCVDMYIPGIRKYFEMGDIAGLVAPKKLLLIQGVNDKLFPVSGVRREFDKAQRIFMECSAPDNVILRIGYGGHRFYSNLATSGAKKLAVI